MPLTLPNLDDRTWQQLTAEARTLLPAYAPAWTDFNPADPGITLIELLAYFTEQMLYRTNRIGDEHTVLFLKLLHGPSWSPTKPLGEEKRLALHQLETVTRAVTAADFETLAIAAVASFSPSHHHTPARAHCIPGRHLHATAPAEDTEAAGHISVVLLPPRGLQPGVKLLRHVKHALHAARLITTHVHVVAPRLLTFSLRITLVLDDHVTLDWIQSAAMNRLQDFFDPHHGGPAGTGWPFGRNVYVSDLYLLLGRIDGVEYVTRTRDQATGKDQPELQVPRKEARRQVLNDRGNLIALTVNESELVSLQFTAEDITLERKGGRA